MTETVLVIEFLVIVIYPYGQVLKFGPESFRDVICDFLKNSKCLVYRQTIINTINKKIEIKIKYVSNCKKRGDGKGNDYSF